MNHTLVDQYFKSFKDYIASGNFSTLKALNKHFMSEVKKEFTDGSFEIRKSINDQKYLFNELVTFLDFCELGQWSNAREKFEKAFEQYQTFVHVVDTLNRNEKELPKPDTTRATTNNSTHAKNGTDSNKSRTPRVSMESPTGDQSAAQPPRHKSQTPLNHVPDNTLSTFKNAAALSKQGRSVEKTSRNRDEHDSKNFNGTQLYHSDYHTDKNQYGMTSDNNDKSILQRATPVFPMEKGLSAPDYQTHSESSKSSIKEQEKTMLLSSVYPRDPTSLAHNRRNKSDHTKRGELSKTEHGPNQVDVYRRSENASILLRYNNPDIEDFFDINRSIQLTERFSELYSNEHTDAFEELEKYHQDRPLGEDQEKEIVEDLLRVVKHAYDHCEQWNENIDNMLRTEKLTKPPRSEDEIIQLKGQQLERKKKLVKDKANDVVQDAIITHVKPGDARKDSVHDDTTRQTASNQQPFSKVQTSIMHRDQANAQVRTDQKQNFSQHNHLQVSATPGDKQISQNQGKSSSRRPREIKEYNSPKNDDNRNDLPDEYGGTKEYLLNEKGIDRTTKQGTEKEENVHVPADICTRRLNPSLLLRENNPKIPELSDPNRPTKLVERFSELYNNEYKDAFEELEKDRFHERDIVYHLLRVVRRAYVHCQYWNRIEKKLREVKYISGLDDEHIHDRGTLEQEREVLMKRRQDMVVQDFMENMISEIVPDEIRKTTKLKYMHFAEQCTEIIWWMCVQNPAMHLECLHDRLNGQSKIHRFNSDLYRTYTNSGEFVDFCVWSLVRLHKGGPILSKGVAQGMNK